MHGLHDKLEASAEHIVTQVDAVAKDLHDGLKRLENSLGQLTLETDQKIAVASDKMESQFQHIADECDQNRRKLLSEFAAVKLSLPQQMQELEDRWAKSEAAAQDATANRTDSALGAASEQMKGYCDRAIATLGVSLENGLDQVTTRVEGMAHALESRIAAGAGQMMDNLSQLSNKLGSRSDNLLAQLKCETVQLAQQTENVSRQINDRVDSELKTVHELLTRGVGKLDTAYHTLDDKVTVQSQELQNNLNLQFGVLEDQLASVGNQAQRVQCDANNQFHILSNVCQELTQRVALDKQAALTDWSRNAAKLDDAVAQLGREISQSHESLLEMYQTVDGRLTQSSAAHDSIISKHYTHFTSECRAMGIRVAQAEEQCYRIDAVSKTVEEHRSSLRSLRHEVEQNVNKNATAQSEATSALSRHCNELFNRIAEKSSEKELVQDAVITAQKRQFEETLVNLDNKVLHMLAELREVVQRNREQAAQTWADVDRQLSSKITDLIDTVSLKNEDQDNIILRVEAAVDETRARVYDECTQPIAQLQLGLQGSLAQLMGACTELESKHQASVSAHELHMQELERSIAEQQSQNLASITGLETLVADSSTVHSAKMSLLGQRIQEDRQHFTNLCAGLDQTDKEHHQHFTNLCAVMDKKFTEKVSAYASRLDNEHDYVVEALANLDQRLVDKCAAQAARSQEATALVTDLVNRTDKTLTDRFEAEDKRVAGLEIMVDDHRRHFGETCTALELKLGNKDALQDERIAELSGSVQSNHLHFTDVCRMLDHKFTEENIANDERSEERSKQYTRLHSELQDQLDAAIAKVSDAVASQHAHFTTECASIEEKCQQSGLSNGVKVEQVASRLDDCTKHVLRVVDVLSDQVCAQGSNLTVKIEEHDSRIHELHSSTSNETQRMEGLLHMLQQSFTGKIAALGEQLHTKHTQALGTCDALRLKLESRAALQNQSMQNHVEHVNLVVHKIERSVIEKDAALDTKIDANTTRIQSVHDFFSNRCSGLERKFDADNLVQDDRMQIQRQHFADSISNMEAVLNEKDSSQDARMEELGSLVQEHHAQLTETCGKLGDKLVETSETCRAATKVQHEHFTEMITTMGAKQVEKDAAQDARLDELDSTLAKHHEHFTNACATGREQFLLKSAAQDERVNTLQQHFEDRCYNLDQKLSDKDSSQDARMEELGSLVQEHHAQMTDFCESLDRKLVDLDTSCDCRLNSHYDHFTVACNCLDEKLEHYEKRCTRMMDQSYSKLADQMHGFTSALKALDTQLTRTTSTLTDRLADESSLFTQLIGNIESKTSELCSEQNARILNNRNTAAAHFAHFSDLCQSLGASLAAHHAMQTDWVKTQQERLTSTCSSLEQSFTEMHDLQECRLNQVEAAMQDQNRYLTSKCTSIEVQVVDKFVVYEEAISESRAHVDDRFSFVETCLSSSVENMRQHVSSACGTIEQKFDNWSNVQDGRINDVAAGIQQQQRHFASVIGGVEKKLSYDVAVQHDRLEHFHSSLTGRCSVIETKAAENVAVQDARMDQLATAAEDSHRHFALVCDKLQSKFSEESTAQNERVESQHSYFSDLCNSIDAKASTQLAVHMESLAELHSQVQSHIEMYSSSCSLSNTKISELIQTQADNMISISNQLEAARAEIDTKFADDLMAQASLDSGNWTALSHKVENLLATVERNASAHSISVTELAQVVQRQQRQNVDMLAHLDVSFGQKFDAQDERLDSLTAIAENRHRNWINSEQQLSSLALAGKEELDLKIDEIKSLVCSECAKLDGAWSAELDHRLLAFSSELSEISVREEDLRAVLKQHHAHFTNVCSQLDKRSAEYNTAHTERVEHHKRLFSDTCSTLEQKISADCDALNQRAKNMYAHFTYIIVNQDDKISQGIVRLDEKVLAVANNLDQKFSMGLATLEDRIANQRQFTTDLCGHLDSKFSAESLNLDEKFVEMCTKLDKKLTGSQTLLASLVESNHKQCSATQAGLETMMLDGQTAVSASLAAHRAEVDTLISDAGVVAQAHCEHFSATAVGLEHKLATVDADLNSKINAQHKHFSSICQSLDQNIGDQIQDLDDRLKARQQTDAERRAQLDSQLVKLRAGIEESTGAQHTELQNLLTAQYSSLLSDLQHVDASLHTSLGEVDARSRNVCDSIKKDLFHQLMAHTTHVNEFIVSQEDKYEKLTHSCSALGEALGQEHMSRIGELKDARSNLVSLASKLDAKFTEHHIELSQMLAQKHSQQDARLDSVSACAELCKDQLTAVVDRIEKRFAGFHSTHEEAAVSQREDLAAACSQLDAKFTQSYQSLHTQLSGQVSYLTSLCADAAASLTRHRTSVDEKLAEAHDTVQKHISAVDMEGRLRIESHYNYFAELCKTLDEKSVSSGDELMQRCTGVATEMDEKFKTQANDMLARIEMHHAHFAGLCSKLEGKYSDLSASHENATAHLRAEIKQRMAEVQVSVADCVDQAARGYASLETTVNDTSAVQTELAQQVT